jgi:hypothetical protein
MRASGAISKARPDSGSTSSLFNDAEAAGRVFAQRRQGHSGLTYPDYFIFIAYGESGGPDVVGAVIRQGQHLFNLGLEIPFAARDARGGDQEKIRSLDAIVGTFVGLMEALTRQFVVADALTDLPTGPVDRRGPPSAPPGVLRKALERGQVQLRVPERAAGSRLGGLLEKSMARIAAAKSQDEYRRVVAEALATLRDGHTGLTGQSFGDQPAVRISPVEGQPVVTAIGNVPELRATGLVPGMKLVAIDGRPLGEVLEQNIYPVVSASTPHGRDVVAFQSLPRGDTDTSVAATFLDLAGTEKTFDLVRDLSRHRGAFEPPPPVECRPLPEGLFYVALNSFGRSQVPEQFDECLPEVLQSRGLIIDVRQP